jgi:hypothetical protein
VLKAAIESHKSDEPGSYSDIYNKIISYLNN